MLVPVLLFALGLVLLIAMGVLVMKLNKAKGGNDTAWVPVTAQSLPSPGRGQGPRP